MASRVLHLAVLEDLRLFREKYGDAENYFKSIGLRNEEIQMIRSKLV